MAIASPSDIVANLGSHHNYWFDKTVNFFIPVYKSDVIRPGIQCPGDKTKGVYVTFLIENRFIYGDFI